MNKYVFLLIAGMTLNVCAQERINWETILPYKDGVAQASRTESYSGGIGEWGLVDEQGITILEPTYKLMRPWREGFAKVISMDNKVGFIDMTGKLVIPFRYIISCDLYYGFSNNFAAVRSYSGWGFINKKGEEVIPTNYSFVNLFNKQGYAVVYEDMQWGDYCKREFTDKTKCAVIDTLGNEIIKMGKYDITDDGENGCFIVKQKGNGKYGVIDINENIIIPFAYNRITAYGMYYKIEVETNRKYGVLNYEGKVVIPPKYESIVPLYFYGNWIYRVLLEKKYGYINERGDIIAPVKYENWNGLPNFWEMECNRTGVCYNNKYGWIDIEGKEVIPCQYDYAENFDCNIGVAPVMKKINGKNKWGLIDTNGKMVLPHIYDRVDLSKGQIIVRLNERTFEVDKNGSKIRDIN